MFRECAVKESMSCFAIAMKTGIGRRARVETSGLLGSGDKTLSLTVLTHKFGP